jgi:UDP-N-acetylglucosamine 2-epimerase (non-hydrolysing)
MKKIMVVFGTRPEAIKMAPICKELLFQKDFFKTTICVTGQHREMLDQVLDIFNLVPDIDLDIMNKGQDLFDVTSKILIKLKDVLNEVNPDIVLVHGDTTTTLSTAMACFYLGYKVGHVEAGLRTHDLRSPFPEEFNRKITGLIADFHFAPTELSKDNLLQEGIKDSGIFVTGNTVIDALHFIIDSVEKDDAKLGHIQNELNKYIFFDWESDDRNKFVLITGHRRENFGQGFLDICMAIKDLAISNPEIHFIYPVHLNPNVQDPVNNILLGIKNVWLIPPLEYEHFLYLLKKSHIILTDSGGIQEEAPSLGKPVLVMRSVTERPEAVEAGTVKLVGTSKTDIVYNIELLLKNQNHYDNMSFAHNPYGDGKSSKKIVNILKSILQ